MQTSTTLQDKVSLLLKSSRDYLESKVELEVLKGADKIAQGTSALAILLF
ncbi:MAG: hypothetical protein H7Y31_01225, partial [Chitinophagaceae bacterium]|nr:hypothetical protein [Chitinophagaceae bacterium]